MSQKYKYFSEFEFACKLSKGDEANKIELVDLFLTFDHIKRNVWM